MHMGAHGALAQRKASKTAAVNWMIPALQPGGILQMFAFCQHMSFILVHVAVERRRRFNINDRIKELGTLLPKSSDP